MQKLKKKLQSSLTSENVRWMKSKSKFVIDIARLAKFWSQTVLYVGNGSGKSFFVEIIAVSAATEIGEHGGGRQDLPRAIRTAAAQPTGSVPPSAASDGRKSYDIQKC